MLILGIESSCDDTSVALVEITDKKIKILAEKTASQIEIHKKYGGVVPEIAGRKHAEQILPVVEEVMKNFEKPDVIAVTSGPGLITGLIVGVETAKTLSYLWDVPIVAVNHIEGHIHSVLINDQRSITAAAGSRLHSGTINDLEFPILSLVASGGHTELILSTKQGQYEKIGGTRDDAAGECFDKVAKLIGFDYPGGPKISEFAKDGNSEAIDFPRPMLNSDNFDMSFSGLKTAALYWLRDNKLAAAETNPFGKIFPWIQRFMGIKKDPVTIQDFCASFEQAVVDVLVTKTIKAAKKYKPKSVILSGGVSANKKLREALKNRVKKEFPASKTLHPKPNYSMDNAAMIAVAAYNHTKNKKFTPWDKLQADPNWKIYEIN